MTALNIDAKFEGKMTCAFKNDMRNLANFYQSTFESLKIWTFIGSFPSQKNKPRFNQEKARFKMSIILMVLTKIQARFYLSKILSINLENLGLTRLISVSLNEN